MNYKNLKNKSQEELQNMLNELFPESVEYRAISFEIQRIQQDTNNKQIANLTEIIKRSEKSSSRLAKVAISIAILSLFFDFFIK